MAKPKPKSLPTPGQIFAALRDAVAEPILLARLPEGDLGDPGYKTHELVPKGQGNNGYSIAVNADVLDESRGDGHWLHGWGRHVGLNRDALDIEHRNNQQRAIPKNFILSPQTDEGLPDRYFIGHWGPQTDRPHFTVGHVNTIADDPVASTETEVNGAPSENVVSTRPKNRRLRWGNRTTYTIPFPDHASASYFLDSAIRASNGPVAEKMLKGLKRELDKRFAPKLNLSFEPPETTPENTWRKDSGGYWYPFKVKGQRYTIKAHTPDKPSKSSIHLFKFEDADGSMDVTGAGNANHVFAHVIHAFKDFAQNHATLPIGFDAEGSESRVKLYRRLAEKLPKHVPGYEVETLQDNGGDKASWLARKVKVTKLSRDTEAALWAEAATNPDARGVLADYLEERGDPLHQVLRNQTKPRSITSLVPIKYNHYGNNVFVARGYHAPAGVWVRSDKASHYAELPKDVIKEIQEYHGEPVSPVTPEAR